MPDSPATTEPRELLELDVGEVSMVDAPAIRRKFVMVKQEAAPGTDNTPTPEPPATPPAPVAPPAGENTVDENEIIAADSDIAKALFPMLTALANEKMNALVEKVASIQTALTAGTLTKKEAREMFSGLSSLLWGAEDDVISISKSAGTPVELDAVQKAKRMTARRIGELKAAQEQITSLLSELEEEVMADTTDTQKTEVGAGTADLQKAITAAVSAGLAAGLEPVNKSITDVGTRLDSIEARVAKVEEGAAAPTATTDTTKTETKTEESAVAKAITNALAPMAKSLEDIGQRLDTIESTPAAGGDDDPASTTTKVETTKAGSADFWAGAGVSPRS